VWWDIANNFKNRSVFDEVMSEILQSLFFSGHGVVVDSFVAAAARRWRRPAVAGAAAGVCRQGGSF